MRSVLSLSICVLSLGILSAAAGSQQDVPRTYFGMHIEYPVTSDPPDKYSVPPGTTGFPPFAFGTLRLSMPWVQWSGIEPTRGSFNWKILDDTVNAAKAAGVTDFVFCLGVNMPSWASRNRTDPPRDEDWTAWVTAAVSHRPDILYWELWNEANAGGFYSGTVPQLVHLAAIAYPIIHSINPNAKVLAPSTSPKEGDAAWTAQYIAAGGAKFADIWTFHGYQGHTPEAVIADAQAMQEVLAQNGLANAPFWNGEGSWGFSNGFYDSIDPNTGKPGTARLGYRAAFVARYMLLQWAYGVQRVIWYAYDDHDYGALYDLTGFYAQPPAISQAGLAYGEIMKWMVGAAFPTLPIIGPASITAGAQGQLYQLPLTRPGYKALAVWIATPSAGNSLGNFTAPPDGYSQYRDVFGKLTVCSPLPCATVPISNWPILLETKTAF